MNRLKHLAVLTALASVGLTACDDNDVVVPGGDDAPFEVVIQPESGTAAASYSLMTPTETSPAIVSLSDVESIFLPIGAVEALEVGGGWVEAGSVNATIDLLNLPDDGITLVDTFLPQGSYTALRFWLTDGATITLSDDIRVGRTTFEAGTHALEIPSADQNGVRLAAEFEVDENGQILTVLVDGDATVRHVVATGAGVLKIAPELRVQNQNGDDVGGIDDGDDDGDDEDDLEREGYVASVDGDTFTFEDGTVVRVTDDTELSGDFLTLADVASALAAGEAVEAEVEGSLDTDGTTIVASEVEFDVEGEVDDEYEIEGLIENADRDGMTFVVLHDGVAVTVVIDEDTELEFDDGLTRWGDVVDALDAGSSVEAEAEGEWLDTDRFLAWEVEFELEDEDDDDD